MFISRIADGTTTPALVATMTFNEARLRTIAENVANSSTPGYRAKQLDTNAFQSALRQAFENRGKEAQKPFIVNDGQQLRTDEFGSLHVTPSMAPAENVLFHDGTNMSIEKQMSDLAETAMSNEFVSTVLSGKYAGLRKAIRGTV